MPLLTLFWHHREFAFLAFCRSLYIIFQQFLFSMSSLDFSGDFGLFWPLSNFAVWKASVSNFTFRQDFYFYLFFLQRLLFLQLSCLDFPVGFGLLWPTTGCHGLPSCFLSLFRFWDSPAVWKIYKSNNKLCPCLCLCLCLCPQ